MSGSHALRGLRAAVVGGSIGGCAAALALHRAGCRDTTVYERTAGALADRGVGVAVHAARYAELAAAGYLDASMPWVRLAERHWYVRDERVPLGRMLGSNAFPFRTYNWGPLWRELRARVPEGVRFRSGTPVLSVAESGAGAAVHTEDGSEPYDLVIGADGYRSVVRAAVCPAVEPRYAGYLAWRGAYPQSRLPDSGSWPEHSCAYVVFSGATSSSTAFRGRTETYASTGSSTPQCPSARASAATTPPRFRPELWTHRRGPCCTNS
ncbi:hypothetical protein [Streptomyces sp. NPDC005953]|uniref:hypothetical protein n=1 Tax=Streptomyces sp. NPDC005953 TaxID=3156719 RepID=UPI0033FF97F0